VVRGESGVWGEDADLKVAELVGGQLAVLEEDEGGVERLNCGVDLNVVGSEEIFDGVEIAFGEGGPEVLFEGGDFYGGRGCGHGLALRGGEGGGDREEEE